MPEGHRAGQCTCPGVGHEREALERLETVETVEDAVEQPAFVAQSVDAVSSGVDNEHPLPRCEAYGLFAQELVAALRAGGSTVARACLYRHGDEPPRADRARPRARGSVCGRQVGEGLLSEQNLGTVRASSQERMATLEDPRVHERADRKFLGRLLDRVPQVGCLGVAVAVSRKVPADTVAEAFGADVLLEHPKKAAALLVGEGVEHRVDFVGRAHRELDRPRRVEPVEGECNLPIATESDPALVLRLEVVQAAKGHVGRERLVQPDAVPPAHGHEVAEPHVCDLVLDHPGDALELVAGRMSGVGEQRGLTEGRTSEVLHRTPGEVGDRDQVELVAWEGLAKVLGVVPERVRAGFESKRGQVRLSCGVNHAQRGSVHIHDVGGLERADDEGDQVGRHRDRVGELEATLAT